MLNLAYGQDVPPTVVDLIEHHARSLGLALGTLECVGTDLDVAEGFIFACERGEGASYAYAVEHGYAPANARDAFASAYSDAGVNA